jgi:hypothetical protein
MATHGVVRSEGHRFGGGPVSQLGWPHFWLLSGVLAGLLGLVFLVIFIAITLG